MVVKGQLFDFTPISPCLKKNTSFLSNVCKAEENIYLPYIAKEYGWCHKNTTTLICIHVRKKKYGARSEKIRICMDSKLIWKDDLTNILHSTCFTSVLVFTFRIFKILLINVCYRVFKSYLHWNYIQSNWFILRKRTEP